MDQNTSPQPLPPGVELIPMAQWKWEKSKSGRENAYLFGHPSQPGPYAYATRWPAHSKALAHTHPDARCGLVLAGVHYIGYGDKFDEAKLHRHEVGTWFTEPAMQGHFGLTKEEGAILYFYGMGPSRLNPLE